MESWRRALTWQFKFSYSLDGILCWFLVLILNFVWKAAEVEAESIALLIFVLWRQFNCRRVRGGEVGQKVLFKASWNRFFFLGGMLAEAIKHDTFWHAVSTGYFYVLFLWPIVVSDFRPLETYKNLGLPLSTITFTVNSHAEITISINICICFK